MIIIGAVTITAFGIDAADTLKGEGGTMLAQLAGKEVSPCPAGMRSIDAALTFTCADTYEVSAGNGCPHQRPQSTLDSVRNIQVTDCHGVSQEGSEPWRFVTRDQALQLCAREGKRLPTAAEWYRIALGSEGQTCITNAKTIQKTGTATCIASSGAYDAVGNAWEWIDGQVTNGTYDGRTLPNNGYVSSVDANGIAVTSTDAPDALYGNDYLWSKTDGVYGMIRGGFYGSGDDAGLYTLNAAVPAGFAAQGVGFRCVKDVL